MQVALKYIEQNSSYKNKRPEQNSYLHFIIYTCSRIEEIAFQKTDPKTQQTITSSFPISIKKVSDVLASMLKSATGLASLQYFYY